MTSPETDYPRFEVLLYADLLRDSPQKAPRLVKLEEDLIASSEGLKAAGSIKDFQAQFREPKKQPYFFAICMRMDPSVSSESTGGGECRGSHQAQNSLAPSSREVALGYVAPYNLNGSRNPSVVQVGLVVDDEVLGDPAVSLMWNFFEAYYLNNIECAVARIPRDFTSAKRIESHIVSGLKFRKATDAEEDRLGKDDNMIVLVRGTVPMEHYLKMQRVHKEDDDCDEDSYFDRPYDPENDEEDDK